jgi:hypothetical protein
MSYKSIRNLNALANHLISRHGLDEATCIFASEYNMTRNKEFFYDCQSQWMAHLAKAAGVSGNTRTYTAQPSNAQRMAETFQEELIRLRVEWTKYNRQLKELDGRTAWAKRIKAKLIEIEAEGQLVAHQVEGA